MLVDVLRHGKWCQSTSSNDRDVDRLIVVMINHATPCRADRPRDRSTGGHFGSTSGGEPEVTGLSGAVHPVRRCHTGTG